jgi:hypothetical protein|tara:strand:+ start:1251 stop:1442 length:192 start_codon:yes stop_codon:yes gene_type:complete
MTSKSEIELFIHCSKCLKEKPSYLTPRDYSMVEVGRTSIGLQVWCIRHEESIVHLDFREVERK